MLPSPDQMMFCIVDDDGVVDGAHGIAIGDTPEGAWSRAIDPCQEWSIRRSKEDGMRVARCAIMVINDPGRSPAAAFDRGDG